MRDGKEDKKTNKTVKYTFTNTTATKTTGISRISEMTWVGLTNHEHHNEASFKTTATSLYMATGHIDLQPLQCH